MSSPTLPRSNRTNVWLWIVQALLAVVFLFTGGLKMAMPSDVLAAQSHLPGLFMKFIGLCELLGALGLILPGLFHVRPGLTPLAAACLVIIMIGATVSSAILMPAAVPVTVAIGALLIFVAYGRWRLAPLAGVARPNEVGATR